MEKINLNKKTDVSKSFLGRLRESIDGKILKILGPVAFAGLLSSCGESEQKTFLNGLEGKVGIESLGQDIIKDVEDIIDFAKKHKKTRFAEGKPIDSNYRIVDVDTILNSISYTEKLSLYNEEGTSIDHHEVHSYYSASNNYFQFFSEETQKKDGEEMPRNEQSILANRENGIILKASNFNEEEIALDNIYALDGAVGPIGNKDIPSETIDILVKRFSSVKDVVGSIDK